MKKFSKINYWFHGTTDDALASNKNGIKVDFRPRPCDFGIGFYLTSNFDQARRWAENKANRARKKNPHTKPVILKFRIEDLGDFQCKEFSLDKEFFDFLYLNRIELGNHPSKNLHDYDMVYGYVLDGRNWDSTLKNVKFGWIDEKEAQNSLIGKYESDDQLAICNQIIADQLVLEQEEFLDVHSKE